MVHQLDLKEFKGDRISQDIKNEIQNDLTNTLASKIIKVQSSVDFWDQPSSYRLLQGLLTTTNKYAELYAATSFIDMNLQA